MVTPQKGGLATRLYSKLHVIDDKEKFKTMLIEYILVMQLNNEYLFKNSLIQQEHSVVNDIFSPLREKS